MSLLDAHFRYRAAGFSTIPVARFGSISKKPLVAWEEYQFRRPRDPEVRNWVMKWPTSNIGLVMAGSSPRHIALDFDGDVHAAYAAMTRQGMKLPSDTPVQRSSRGLHVLLSVPWDIGDRVAWMSGPGWQVDVRGVGYIIVAPSIHQDGTAYEWARPFYSPAAPAPMQIVDLLTKPKANDLVASPPPDNWAADLLLHGSPEGQRNNDGTRLAGYFLKVLPEDIATAAMYCFAEHCSPPMSRAEIDGIVASVARYRR